jgi:hypothetical protein
MIPNNYILYGMIIYILIILLIVCIKPNFVYDHNNKRFRNFGWNFSNISDSTSPTPLSVGSISVMLAIMIGCVVGLSDRNKPVEVVQKSKIYYLKVSPDGRMEVVKDIMQQVPQTIMSGGGVQPIMQQVPQTIMSGGGVQPIMQQVPQTIISGGSVQPIMQQVPQTIMSGGGVQPIMQQVPQTIMSGGGVQPIMQQVSQHVSQPLSQLVQQTIPYYEQPKFIPFYTGSE